MEELIEKAKKGDTEAFGTLIISVEKDLYKIAKARLLNEDDVNDAVQETIIKAFKSIKKLQDAKYFKTWIIRILINKSNDIYKTKNKNVVLFNDIRDDQKENSYTNENIDIKLDFNFICNKLKYEDRLIIILFYVEGFTDKEIGKIMKLNENTIKTKRTRAKQKIKDILELGGQINYGRT